MILLHSIQDLKESRPLYLTQGTFDGLHQGHQSILHKLIERTKTDKAASALLTFYPHPRLVLYPDDNALRLLTTLDEKAQLLEEMGLDYLIVLPFTHEFARLSAFQFIRDILVTGLNMKMCIIGYDHRFGKNREGSLSDLEEFAPLFAYEVQEIPPHDVNQAIVSSTKIRQAILEGDLSKANQYLGRFYGLSGTVVHGKKRGHSLGYPTANIGLTDAFKLIPPSGVYAVLVDFEKQVFKGMLNVGNNPTFGDVNWTVEVHLFNFNKDIYGKLLKISFVSRIRDVQKFADAEALIYQLKEDELHAKNMLHAY